MTDGKYQGRRRMPVVFGPTTGPRQGPDGKPFNNANTLAIAASISFLSDWDALNDLLPPMCEPVGEPIVTFEHTQLKEVEWLAGRGYSMLGVRFPVRYRGPKETLVGSFLSVLWENMPEPILSGREELGFAKVFCELPEPRILGDRWTCAASWDCHEFFRMDLEGLAEAEAPPPPPKDFAGIIHHRYIPAVAPTATTELEQMVISPMDDSGPKVRIEKSLRGTGRATFYRSTWEQLPTMFQIVNRLADLPVLEWRDATVTHSRGKGDMSNQRVLG